MRSPVVFLYTSYRTGGTAFLSAFNADPTNMVFFDPLNVGLLSLESARNFSSENWNSNHPANLHYFESYLPMFEQGTMNLLPDLSEFKFRNSSAKFKDQLVQYLRALSDFAHSQEKLPVFKLEQLKGHVGLLRKNFPEALHVGFVRNPNDQFKSWLEQFAYGNGSLFDTALNFINGDAEFFKPKQGLSNSNLKDLFDIYYSRLLTLRSELDFTHNLYEESFQDLIGKIASNFYKDKFILAVEEFNKITPRITFEKKFDRMMNNSLKLTQQRDELTQQRDELTQQRDELTQQRDELTQQRDELLNSTIWKVTKPFRVLINFIKK
jgi:hypothetical protein